jgi:hypothetical protein
LILKGCFPPIGECQVAAAGDDRQVTDLVDDEQGEAAEVANFLANRAFAFGRASAATISASEPK